MDLVTKLQKEAGGVERIDLKDLIAHSDFVYSDLRLDQVYEAFKENGHDYMAVIDEEHLLGLCSKTDIGFLLGSRFGFAVMGKKTIREHLIPNPICLIRGLAIRDSLTRVLSRSDKQFYEDVVLADEDGTYLGIIPVPHLVHLQTALMQEKYVEMESHSSSMEETITRLEKSKKRNELLFENRAIGILFLDHRGAILEGNQKMVEMLGYHSSEMILNLFFADWIVASDQGRFHCYFEETLQNSSDEFLQSQEFQFLLDGGRKRFFRIQFGHVWEYRDPCLFVFDVTEQKEMEKAMMSREKTAVVESLVCGIAHELNNKLSPIMGLSELMLMDCERYGSQADGFKERLQTVYDTSKEAGIMIRQLQQLSHPKKPQYQDCDVRELLASVHKMVRHTLAQEEIEYTERIPFEKTIIRVDPSQMKQVFLNLIFNAIHAMKRSSRKNLRVEVLSQPSKIVFLIQDTGEGIPEALIGKIFEPYFTTKQGYEGTGLGLSVCQSLVQNHEGVLGVTSQLGEGATFSVTIPLQDASQVVLPEKKNVGVTMKMHEMDFLQESNILIVDDEADICQLMVSAFSGVYSTRVQSAYSQEKAIDLLKMYRFDWVISDLRMPFYNGLDLYDWISSNQPHLKNRFLLITGESEISPLSKSVDELGIPVVRKPFSMVKLTQGMKSLLDDVRKHPRVVLNPDSSFDFVSNAMH